MSLQRSTPLRRSPMKRKRLRRLDRPGSDPGYKAWIHEQVCVGWMCRFLTASGTIHHGPRCSPREVQQSHLRSMTGMGRKEPDAKSIPMCRSLHEDWEQHKGCFAGWDKPQRLAWFLLRIAEANAAYLEQGGVLA